jgi:hypothetical protein
MKPLTGLGIWIWELGACEGGSIAGIAAKARKSGVAWVAIKAGESNSNGQVTTDRVKAIRDAGLECAAWWYSRPGSTTGERALLQTLVDVQGVRHLIQDAEEEWETVKGPNGKPVPHDFRPDAKAFATQVRAALGADVFIADAPWARPQTHGGTFPYAEFGAMVDARFPQFYWEGSGIPQPNFLQQADEQWAPLDTVARTSPVGSPVDGTGTKRCPVSEVGAFLDRYAGRAARSLWSWQHLDAAEWALLQQRAAVQPIA